MADLILALDQGTTSTRAIAFRAPSLAPVATARRDLPQHFPASGWVEHDPEDLWNHAAAVLREALAQAGGSVADVAAIGITNQRETTLIWDRATGAPIHRAIVWQDRRTAAACAALAGHEALVTARTGLLIDPYFCATKIAWMLDNVPGARARAGTRRARLRHGRLLPALEAHRRPRARDRCDQCEPHAAVRHPQGRLGRRAARAVPRAARAAARGARLRRRIRPHRAARRRDPDLRHRRRPAGGDGGPGLLRARHGEGDLRHRLLRPAQHRRHAGRLAATGC